MILFPLYIFEGNISMNDPPAEVIALGAQGVVEYFKDKVKNDEEGRIRNIVVSVQDCLHQVSTSCNFYVTCSIMLYQNYNIVYLTLPYSF